MPVLRVESGIKRAGTENIRFPVFDRHSFEALPHPAVETYKSGDKVFVWKGDDKAVFIGSVVDDFHNNRVKFGEVTVEGWLKNSGKSVEVKTARMVTPAFPYGVDIEAEKRKEASKPLPGQIGMPEAEIKVKPSPKKAKIIKPIVSVKGNPIQIERNRSARSRALDESQLHSVVIEPSSPKVKRWIKDQGTADIRGIDTPKVIYQRGDLRITLETEKPKKSRNTPGKIMMPKQQRPARERQTNLASDVVISRGRRHIRLA